MIEKRGIGFRGSSQGQVTVFIIVGILILLVFAGIFYFFRSSITEKLTAEGEPVLAEVPSEFQPVQSYTDNCISQISKRGVKILGQQGGYIYPDLAGDFSPVNPTDADGINLDPVKVPYWYYNKQPNRASKISLTSLQPKLHSKDDPYLSIEAQLARFVNEKLGSCLQNYTSFAQQGLAVQILSPQESKVVISANTVNVQVNMKLQAKSATAEHQFDTFYIKIPIALQHYYDVAEQITKAEQNYSFLEHQGLDLIQVYSAVDHEKLPPTNAATFELFSNVFWATSDVKEKFRELLSSNVPLLRLASSNNFYRYEYPVSDLSGLYQKTYDNMILPIPGADDTAVSFDYFDWEPYLNVNDKGGIITPTEVTVNYQLLHFGTQSYTTLYDVSYPVLVSMHDEKALDGEGFTFSFALEANIRNNEPAVAEQELSSPVAAFTPSLACNPNQWKTQLLRTVVVDSYTKQPLEAVQLGFSIPEQDTCQMGETNEQGELESKYPAVYGGVLSISKLDYLTDLYPLDTYKYQDHQAVIGYAIAQAPQPVIEMHQLKNINITVKKKSLEECISSSGIKRCFTQGLFAAGENAVYKYKPQYLGSEHQWFFTGTTKSLLPSEQATITLTRIRDLNPAIKNPDFGTAVSITGTGTQQVQLVPGVYSVTGFVILQQPIVIPQEQRCGDDIILGLGESCFTIDEVSMDKFIEGQLQWDLPETYLTITPEDLYSAKTIEFYVPTMNILAVPAEAHLRVTEDLQLMGQLGNISTFRDIRSALEPRFN